MKNIVLDLKEIQQVVKDYVKQYGIQKTYQRFKEDYKFFPQLQKTLLFYLTDLYPYYNTGKE